MSLVYRIKKKKNRKLNCLGFGGAINITIKKHWTLGYKRCKPTKECENKY